MQAVSCRLLHPTSLDIKLGVCATNKNAATHSNAPINKICLYRRSPGCPAATTPRSLSVITQVITSLCVMRDHCWVARIALSYTTVKPNLSHAESKILVSLLIKVCKIRFANLCRKVLLYIYTENVSCMTPKGHYLMPWKAKLSRDFTLHLTFCILRNAI